MNLLLPYLALYFALLFLAVFIISRKQSREDFLISGRNRSSLEVLSSKFSSSIGISWFIVYTGYAYAFGFGMFAILLGFALGYLIFAGWAVPRIYQTSREQSLYTLGDLVEHRLKSRFARHLADWTSMLILFLWLVITLIGGGKIINHYGLLDYSLSVCLTGLVVLAYLLIGGFRAVIITDILQSALILGLLAVITWAITQELSVGQLLQEETGRMNPAEIVGFLLYGGLSMFAFADRYQLAFAGKSLRAAKTGIGLAFIPVFICGAMLLLIGLFMHYQNPDLDPGIVFMEAMSNFLSKALYPFAAVLLFAGLMSSADTTTYAIASQYSFLRKKTGDIVKKIRITTSATVLLGVVAALIFRNIIDVTIFAAAFTLVLAIPMIYSLCKAADAKGFVSCLLFGLGLFVLGLVFTGASPALALYPVLGSLLGLAALSLSPSNSYAI